MQVRSVLAIAIGLSALAGVPGLAAEKSVLAGNTGLSINSSGRLDLVTSVPIDYYNRSVANGRRVVNLRIAQPMLCADFAPAPGVGVNPVALQYLDPNGDSSGLLFGSISSFDYLTNGGASSLFKVTADAQLACCVMLPAGNANCFQGVTGGSGGDGVFSNGFEGSVSSVALKGTVNPVNLSVSVTGPSTIAPNSNFNYTITVSNPPGSATANDVRVRDWYPKSSGGFPAPLSSGSWTCSASGSASCGISNGVGNIANNTVSLAGGSNVTFSVSRTMGGAAANGTQFSVSAAAFAPPAAGETILGNNQGALTATVQDSAPPVLSNILDQNSLEDTATGSIAFTASDVDSVLTTGSLSCVSNNSTLIDASGCQFTGSEPNFNLVLTPKAHANGTANITVIVTDGSTQVPDAFNYTVTAVNDAPQFSLGPNISVASGTTGIQFFADYVTSIRRGPVLATDETSQSFVQRTVTVDSGGSIFSSAPGINYSGSPEGGTLAYGLNGTSGTATIRVRMQDNGGTANGGDDDTEQTFTITVQQPN